MRAARRRAVLIALAGVALLAIEPTWDLVMGTSFLVRAAGIEGAGRTAARWLTGSFSERLATATSRHGAVRVRVYQPAGRPRRAVLVAPGVHARGIDEPRLVSFSRELAASGFAVATPELLDLQRYRITPRTTDTIEDATAWLSTQTDLAPDGRVGLMGISFAGGLAIVASARPGLRDRVAFVFSFGGHGDLFRVLRYLCTGLQPDGARRPPHDYGVAITLLAVADRMVPPDQVPDLQRAITAFLEEHFDEARQLAATLPEPSATLMREVNARDVAVLGPKLLPHVQRLTDDRALSPERAAAPRVPVYLLHGADDNVIPAVESRLLADRLRPAAPVHYLISPLITHVELNRRASLLNVWQLTRFWAQMLDE